MTKYSYLLKKKKAESTFAPDFTWDAVCGRWNFSGG